MDARIVVAGSELLGDRQDTNGPATARRLELAGYRVASLEVVPDDLDVLRRAVAVALESAQLVVVLGGLGPTSDDLTREAVAAATGMTFVEDAATRAALEEKARSRSPPAPLPSVLKMALVPQHGEVIPNPVGSAVGSVTRWGDRVLVLLPGPPAEHAAMVDASLERAGRALAGMGAPPRPLLHRVLRVAGLFESATEELLRGVPELDEVRVSYLCRPGDLEVHLRCGDTAALQVAAAAARATLAPHVYSDDGRSLSEVVVAVLTERFETVTMAESCTGGMVAAAVTSVPGSAQVLSSAFVTYAIEAKVALLDVPARLLETHGPVSEPVADAMARGARRAARADWALAVTGLAGPDGGTPDRPVGVVFVGLAHADGTGAVERHHFTGDRDGVRQRSVQAALDLLRRTLLP